MKVEQLSVFIENKCGRLADVAATLGKANINIRALSLADTRDFGVIRLIVNDVAGAKNALKTAGFTTTINEVLAIEVSDRPGGLSDVLQTFAQHDLNVEYMYAFVGTVKDEAIMIFRFEDIDKALTALKGISGISILGGETLYAL